jgi:hypothetical protein
MADLLIKRNDTSPVLVTTLTEGTPATAINLTTATAVKLYLRKQADIGSVYLSKTCSITNAIGGQVTVTFSTGDLAIADTYLAEFEITWTGGGIETVPNSGYKSIQVRFARTISAPTPTSSR